VPISHRLPPFPLRRIKPRTRRDLSKGVRSVEAEGWRFEDCVFANFRGDTDVVLRSAFKVRCATRTNTHSPLAEGAPLSGWAPI
jgi:hypothetical protein